jgi:hypothetical protein
VEIREGVANLVNNCAEVSSGESVLVLNENGKVDGEVADLIAEAVKAAGAECHVLWGEPIERGRPDLPKVLVGAMLSADKVICNFGLNRAVVDGYTRGKGLVQINNTCRTGHSITTPHATFHWGMVRTIYARLEEIFAAANSWRITSPAGTAITGRIGKGSDVADAYFTTEAEASRFIRVFPGEVYTPVGCLSADGTIVAEYINMRDAVPWPQPAFLTVKDSRVVKIDGGDEASRIEREVEANVRSSGDNGRVIDSWHGGMNPKARVPTAEDPSLQGATSGPGMMHFHLGRILEPISAGVLNHTVEVDGRKIYENGKLLILDDPTIRTAANQYGVEDL